MKKYVFTFLGEFGYELLNWQGVVRKWHYENPNTEIIICSRAGIEPFYEFANHYINISNVESYNKTVADCYRGYVWKKDSNAPFDDWKIIGSGSEYDKLLSNIKSDIKNLVHETIGLVDEWIWSSDYQQVDECHFGHGGPGGGSVYSDGKFFDNNRYEKIKIHNIDDIKIELQNKIDVDLDSSFILCQNGYRAGKGYTRKSDVKIDHSKLFETIDSKFNMIFLNFDSGRYWDSTSTFDDKIKTYSCSNFSEQACLVLLSRYCIFTTEGDFRSHTYVPPMLGKDVHVVASREVLQLPSSSVDFWNSYLFKFGGKMYTHEYETFENWKIK